MNKPPRLILWANDSPLNAVDGVCEAVVEDIERCLNEAEEDSCFVNDVVAYVRCLTGVYDWAGAGCDECERLESWRARAIKVITEMPSTKFEDEDERNADMKFVNEVFDDLRGIVTRTYD